MFISASCNHRHHITLLCHMNLFDLRTILTCVLLILTLALILLVEKLGKCSGGTFLRNNFMSIFPNISLHSNNTFFKKVVSTTSFLCQEFSVEH